MGKKATLLLSKMLFAGATYMFAILAIMAWLAGIISPKTSWFLALLALGLTPLLVINFVILIFWAIHRKWVALAPLCAILLNISYISAIFQFDFRSIDSIPQSELKIATYNIHGYIHSDFNGTVGNMLDYFNQEKVDIICMQEFCTDTTSSLDSVTKVFPYHVVHSDFQTMKLAVFSKYPITDSRLIPFDNSSNAAMWVDLEVKGRKLRIFSCHFQTTNINQSAAEISRLKSLGIESIEGKEAFDEIMRRLAVNASKRVDQVAAVCQEIDATSPDRAVVLCGDFNDPPGSYTYRTFNKKLIDGFRESGSGYNSTFKAIYSLFRLDYMFHNQLINCVKYYSPNLMWSDHIPVISEFVFVNP